MNNIFTQKYTIFSSTISKWARMFIFHHFEVLMRPTQPPNMNFKLHLEVVEPDIHFFWVLIEFVWSFHYRVTIGDISVISLLLCCWRNRKSIVIISSKWNNILVYGLLNLAAQPRNLLASRFERHRIAGTYRKATSKAYENSNQVLTIPYIP